MIQEEFTFKHINFFTLEDPVQFSECNITMEFSQKFIDELLRIFEVTGKTTTTGLKLQALSKDPKAQCDKVIHQNAGQL